MNRLLWFRNDLRVLDQPALHHCCEDARADQNPGEVSALYILCQEYIDTHPLGLRKLQFIKEALLNLNGELNGLGIGLEVVYVARKKDIACNLLAYCKRHSIRAVYLNREYLLDELRRDEEAERQCAAAFIDINAFHDRCLIRPASLKTKAGGCYKVFTPFARAWHQRARESEFRIYPKPEKIPQQGRASQLDTLFDRLATGKEPSLYPASEEAALARLGAFVADSVHQYHRLRDFPAEAATSALSPYLSVGLLSPKQCYLAVWQAGMGDKPGANTWINELIWREFYTHLAATYPGISKGEPLQAYTEKIPWRNSEADFKRWCAGQTGVPIIDAAMRGLHHTGWMHNRLRMICAMFLSKNLLIDWRKGEEYFMRQLVDADFASNNGGWQWCASTGADAAPYFRVMNPHLQSQKFDPEGVFIRQWVPEIAHLNNREIHSPDKVAGYPPPMVNLKQSRQRAIEVFKQARALSGD